jgi:hypothetical protein
MNWRSLANNCGYEAYLDNSFRANTLYAEYPRLGEWTLSGIFLRETPLVEKHIVKLYIKMNPTQFKNNMTEDIVVYQTSQTLREYNKLEEGDVVTFTGQWEGREDDGHLLRFVATKVAASGGKSDLNNIPLLSSAQRFIRTHENEQHKDEGSQLSQN